MKIDSTVRRETLYVSSVVLLLSAVMQAVFIIIGKWNYTVLLGNVLSGIASILNFFLMGITVQKAVEKEEKEAKNLMKISQMLRMFMVAMFAMIGILLPCFNTFAVIIPLFFPRIAFALRPVFDKKSKKENNQGGENE